MEALDIAQRQITAGDRVGARRTLIALLREEPDAVEAWLLLASLLPDPARQAECYRQVLRVEPHHLRATALLSELSRRQPAVTPRTPTSPPSPPAKHPPSPPTGLPSPFAEGEYPDEGTSHEEEQEIPDEILTDLNAELDSPEPPDEQERALRDWVVRELTNYEGQAHIIRQICSRNGMDWPQAEKLVLRIAQQERHTIAQKQAPLVIALSLAAIIGGPVIVIYTFRPEGFLITLGGLVGLLQVWYKLRKK